MAISVRRTYACPQCSESFTKWGLCQTHVRGSQPCREALSEKLRDVDALQELCRAAAASVCDDPAPDTDAGATAPLASAATAPAVEACIAAVPQEVAESAPPVLAAPSGSREEPGDAALASSDAQRDTGVEEAAAVLDASVIRRLDNAVRIGALTRADRDALDGELKVEGAEDAESPLQRLAQQPAEMQRVAIKKFLALGPGQLRHVANKANWLNRCLSFCLRLRTSSGQDLRSENPSPRDWLLEALADHALLPDALSRDCWNTYTFSSESLQRRVSAAVRRSILANVQGTISNHFMSIVRNEKAIDKLEVDGIPALARAPEQLGVEDVSNTLYGRLLVYLNQSGEQRVDGELAGHSENSEEMLLRELGGVDAPELGGLLHTHAATREVRKRALASRSSALHAAAACGYVRICARFIAEGLEVWERAGTEDETPLHVAVAHGQADVVRLLLDARADPCVMDRHGKTPFLAAMHEAVRARNESAAKERCVKYELVFRASVLLLVLSSHRGPDSLDVKAAGELAESFGLVEFRNLVRLHKRIRDIRDKFRFADETVAMELCRLQYETALFLIMLFERHVSVGSEAAQIELRALIASEFIQARDEVQRYGNRLAQRLGLSKRAVDALMELPPSVGKTALGAWKIEETEPNCYRVWRGPSTQAGDAGAAEGEGGVGILSESGKQRGAEKGAAEPKVQGRVRKWDSERGFGFIVQDPLPGEDAERDIFVHRKNLVGSSPTNHIDLRENCRIAYRLGDHDGRPRALEATMIDENGAVLPVHFAKNLEGEVDLTRTSVLDDPSLDDEPDTSDASKLLMRHLKSAEVQDEARAVRNKAESWFRCVGFRRNTGRRDDAIWKREVERRIDIFLETTSTPLQKKDFDFRVRKFLTEFSMQSNIAQVSEALVNVEAALAGKIRNEVRVWPAYIATLLRNFDPKLHEALADRDRRARSEALKGKADEGAGNSLTVEDTDPHLAADRERDSFRSSEASSQGDSGSEGGESREVFVMPSGVDVEQAQGEGHKSSGLGEDMAASAKMVFQ